MRLICFRSATKKPVVVSLWFLLLLLVLLIPSFTVSNNIEYDDSRRRDCMQSINSSFGNSLDDAATRYMKSMNLLILEKHPGHITMQTSYSDEANAFYQKSCQANGGIWTEINLATDCQKEMQEKILHELNIYVRNGMCFPKNTNKCDHYAQNPIDWQMDMLALFGNACTIRDESLSETYASIILANNNNTKSLLESAPRFEDWSQRNRHDHNDAQRQTCFETWKENLLHHEDELQDEIFDHTSQTNTDLLQVDPFLMQREYYTGNRLKKYQELCIKNGNGRFEIWNGTLDCLGIGTNNKGLKLTIVSENAAVCFPTSKACDDYTIANWKLDTMMSLASYSCTIREEGNAETLSATSAEMGSSPKGNTEVASSITSNKEQETTPNVVVVVVVVVAGGLSLLALMAVVIKAQRRSCRTTIR